MRGFGAIGAAVATTHAGFAVRTLGDVPVVEVPAPQQKRREDDAKARAVAGFGEAVAQRLYPRAKFRPSQYREGGSDFDLPGGGFLEAKMAAVGKRVEVQPRQVEELGHAKSRVVVVLYNRQCAVVARSATAFADPATWVPFLAQCTAAVLDLPGPWFLEALRARGRRSEAAGLWIKTADFVDIVASSNPGCKLVKTLGLCVHGVRVQRWALPFYIVGKASQHLDLRPTRARACTIPTSEELPF